MKNQVLKTTLKLITAVLLITIITVVIYIAYLVLSQNKTTYASTPNEETYEVVENNEIDINKIIEKTKNNTGLVLNIAFNYGGRDEIVRAVRKIAEDVKENKINVEDINEQTISNSLYTAGQLEPDLLIRTSGEQRLSNFLLWQLAYTEFYFVQKYWPDFSEQDLDEAISVFEKRNRKFGGK
jgi:undecaprenyl diphosphate synthase